MRPGKKQHSLVSGCRGEAEKSSSPMATNIREPQGAAVDGGNLTTGTAAHAEHSAGTKARRRHSSHSDGAWTADPNLWKWRAAASASREHRPPGGGPQGSPPGGGGPQGSPPGGGEPLGSPPGRGDARVCPPGRGQIPPDLVVKSQAIDITEIILSRVRRPNAVQTLCRNRISRFERLSTSDAHWSTTKSDGMWAIPQMDCGRVALSRRHAVPLAHCVSVVLVRVRLGASPLLQEIPYWIGVAQAFEKIRFFLRERADCRL
jgi:hypothetical protein